MNAELKYDYILQAGQRDEAIRVTLSLRKNSYKKFSQICEKNNLKKSVVLQFLMEDFNVASERKKKLNG